MNYGDVLTNRLRPRRVYRRVVHEAQRVAAPITSRRTPLRSKSFQAHGEVHPYFVHRHNMTWRNERAVEIPMALAFLDRVQGIGVEFGNVLANYGRVPSISTVVDKYETGENILNVDILNFRPLEPVDFVVSISTIEHVGFDEPDKDPSKVDRTVSHLRGMLCEGGRAFVTAPLGHNPALDEAVIGRAWPVIWQTAMLREKGRWIEGDIAVRPYDPLGGARCVWLAELPAFVTRLGNYPFAV